MAYDFTEKFNQKILNNPLHSKTECILTFKKNISNQRSSSTINIKGTRNYSFIRPKLYHIKKTKIINQKHSFISDYERVHWAKIKDKAGIIENDSPYIDSQSKDYIEKKQNQKKWVNKQNFNIFVGNASKRISYDLNEIKNYVCKTPSLPPLLYQFRGPDKKKWIGNRDFYRY